MIDKIFSAIRKNEKLIYFICFIYFLIAFLFSFGYLGIVFQYLDVFKDNDLKELYFESFSSGVLFSFTTFVGLDLFCSFVDFLIKRFNIFKARRTA